MGWDDDNIIGLRIVIIQNAFTIQTYTEDFKEKVIKLVTDNIGEVDKVVVYQHNPDGIVQVRFKKPKEAEACIEEFNEKEMLGRVVKCFFWDGKTDYRRVRYR